jgi:hypothetical protein
MARNYGIGMLILFALAIAYQRWRGRGVALGALLFLLANTNVIATISRKARLDLTLGGILDQARAIHNSTGKPVVILLAWHLGDMDPERVYRESYVWTFSFPRRSDRAVSGGDDTARTIPQSNRQRKL